MSHHSGRETGAHHHIKITHPKIISVALPRKIKDIFSYLPLSNAIYITCKQFCRADESLAQGKEKKDPFFLPAEGREIITCSHRCLKRLLVNEL